MKYLITLSLLLTACQPAVPVKPKWPEIPPVLESKCLPLKEIDYSAEKLSDVLTVVTDNYTLYRECQIKIDTWLDWYQSEKQIYEKIK